MKRREKVIITCAITGAAHTPTMSPHLPITPEQIAEQALEAAEAGAAMIHLHAREPEDGFPTNDTDIYEQFLTPIKADCDAIINITTGQPDRQMVADGDSTALFQRRLAAPKRFEPEVCSFNLGPMIPGVWAVVDRFEGKWLHEWEKPFLEATKHITMTNTYAGMEQVALELGRDRGIKFEFEAFDIGQLYTLKYMVDQGWLKPPYFIQSVMGFPGGLEATPQQIVHMKETADKLFGDDYHWSCLAAGKDQIAAVTQAALLGGHVRVGLEDSLWYGKGRLAKSNAEQVRRIRRILEELSLEIATPDEARAMIGTKGADQTKI
ncbi:MAG: 3-keto-5-aminohexanoate cleavage protein [Pseudomonadota bacterium]